MNTLVLLLLAFTATAEQCTDNDEQIKNLNQPGLENCCDVADFCQVLNQTGESVRNICCVTCSEKNNISTWTKMYVRYAGTGSITDKCGPYMYGDANRQHLHIWTPPAATGPVPVLLWAHGNGGKARQGIEQFVPGVAGTSYGIVSWESVTAVMNENDFNQCWSDLELVMDWVKANGAANGLSTDDWIIGGRSRGTICSWQAAHSGNAAIKGMYLYAALPLPEETVVWLAENITNTSSPPAYLSYPLCCPNLYPADCDVNGDIHTPRSGQIIVKRYNETGMAANITMSQCLKDDDDETNDGILHFFHDFVQSVVPENICANCTTPPPPCTDDDAIIIQLASTAGKNVTGCADPEVAQYCEYPQVDAACCATCAAVNEANGKAVVMADSMRINPFFTADQDTEPPSASPTATASSSAQQYSLSLGFLTLLMSLIINW